MVRDAKFVDTGGILLLLQEGFARSIYAKDARAAIDVPAAKALLRSSMQRHGDKGGGGCFVQVAETGGVINGLIVGTLGRVYSIGNMLMATDLLWLASPSVEPGDPFKLMKNMIEWAKSSPHVIDIKCGTTAAISDDPAAAGVILQRLGMTQYGRLYRMEV